MNKKTTAYFYSGFLIKVELTNSIISFTTFTCLIQGYFIEYFNLNII